MFDEIAPQYKTSKRKMLLIAEKETFVVRVLQNKAEGTGTECVLVPYEINGINAALQDCSLVTLYMDDGAIPQKSVIHFLSEKLEEKGIRMILIGAQTDLGILCDQIPGEQICKTLSRPVDNARFVELILEEMGKVEAGEMMKRILIVDDDPQYLSLVREWLKDTYKVTMANSGLQAIKWLGKNSVDLILLDHEMPVTSGPQVLEMLRSDAETASIPVMFLTGKSDKQSVMAVVALKPEGYFLKSIKKDELLEKLSEFFILHKKQF